MNNQFEEFTADEISRVVFGSNHREADGVHLAQEVQFLAFSSIFNVFRHVPGFRCLPTKNYFEAPEAPERGEESILANIFQRKAIFRILFI